MQDAPIHCPADVEATEAEQATCEAPKPVKPGDDGTVKPLGGGGGTTNPPEPPKKN